MSWKQPPLLDYWHSQLWPYPMALQYLYWTIHIGDDAYHLYCVVLESPESLKLCPCRCSQRLNGVLLYVMLYSSIYRLYMCMLGYSYVKLIPTVETGRDAFIGLVPTIHTITVIHRLALEAEVTSPGVHCKKGKWQDSVNMSAADPARSKNGAENCA